MGKAQGRQGIEELRAAGIPVYLFPEEAARAMAGLDRYRRIRERPEGEARTFPVDHRRAEAALRSAAASGHTDLTPEETGELLAAYGFPVVPSRIVRTQDEAIAAAGVLGYPVVVKAVAEDLVHKTDRGAVKLDLRNADEVAVACRSIKERLGRTPYRLQVQTMVRGGRETILGVAHDPKFGPILMFGLGGIFVEVMKDVVFRILPITDVEGREMVRGIRGHPLLAGARGEPPADEEFLVEEILRLGQMALECPAIEQVDINPLIVGPDRGASFVVDARVRIAAPPGAAPGAASGGAR
jgi:acetate---CoA ligase (ADP-forming)